MSLVRELEEKRVAERRQLMEAMAAYLRSQHIENELIDEPGTSVFGSPITETAIQLKNSKINTIRLISNDYMTCGVSGSVSRFQYQIISSKQLGSDSVKHLSAKTKTVKDKKVLGLFGGDIVNLKWVGNGLASQLNTDSEIAGMLVKCAKSWENVEFQIQSKPPEVIEIYGPSFSDMARIQKLYDTGQKNTVENCVFGFKICDRIAIHIIDLINR